MLGPQTTKALAKVVKDQGNGPELLDMLTALSVGAPRDDGYIDAIQQAANGNDASLQGAGSTGVSKAVHRWTTQQLSQGLHASTLCADWPAPWGDASAPLKGREAALDDAAAKLTDADLYPYDRETATGNGFVLQCLYWPPVDDAEAGRPHATCPTSRPCCSAATATSRPRRVGAAGAQARARREADDRQGRRPRRAGPGRPEALAAVRRLVASPG